MLHVLHDYLHSHDDKERMWWSYKRASLGLADRLLMLAEQSQSELLEQHALRVQGCGNVLKFKRDVDGHHLVLYQAYFCKDRLCAMCQWRRMLKVTYQMRKTIEQSLIRYPSSRFLFLTLTVKDVKGEDLRSTLKTLNSAFTRMVKWRTVKTDLIGFVRSAEVTVNRETMMYHPHLHVLLQVRSSYFKGGHYLKHADWQALWRMALRIDYDPMVNIQVIKPSARRHDGDSILNATAEVGKYQVKPAMYLSEDSEVDMVIIDTLRTQLRGLRMVTYGLALKDINAELFKNDDATDAQSNLVKVGKDPQVNATADEVTAVWNSHIKNYVIVREKGSIL